MKFQISTYTHSIHFLILNPRDQNHFSDQFNLMSSNPLLYDIVSALQPGHLAIQPSTYLSTYHPSHPSHQTLPAQSTYSNYFRYSLTHSLIFHLISNLRYYHHLDVQGKGESRKQENQIMYDDLEDTSYMYHLPDSLKILQQILLDCICFANHLQIQDSFHHHPQVFKYTEIFTRPKP